mmetsp:Transcript_5142/g.7891  ORF Transcript_5142/g.7891 Transcript_5142/m.7891 type:complete len:112 (+) Transcript_5142:692-1027(+)
MYSQPDKRESIIKSVTYKDSLDNSEPPTSVKAPPLQESSKRVRFSEEVEPDFHVFQMKCNPSLSFKYKLESDKSQNSLSISQVIFKELSNPSSDPKQSDMALSLSEEDKLT